MLHILVGLKRQRQRIYGLDYLPKQFPLGVKDKIVVKITGMDQ